GMAVTLGMMSVAFSFGTLQDGAVTLPQPWSLIALICANGFVVFFGATWGPLVWVLLGEMFPNSIRAGALAVAAAAQWVAILFISSRFACFSAIFMTFAYGCSAFLAIVSFILVYCRVRLSNGGEI